MKRITALVLACGLVWTGCGRKKHKIAPSAARNVAPAVGAAETGVASWYGHPYHGRPAADGEIYDMEQMVAAHRTLPFNTWVRVENLSNGKTVDVRIIDRGPFIEGRIIDLSHAAAQDIDMIGSGIAQVRVIILAPPPLPEAAVFAVQVGAFANRANAARICEQMQARFGSARLTTRQGSVTLWRVLVGAEPTTEAAGALAAQIRQIEETQQAFVVHLDKPLSQKP